MWILIISLAIYDAGVSIHSIEFSSKEACMSAATQYKVPDSSGLSSVKRSLICVKK